MADESLSYIVLYVVDDGGKYHVAFDHWDEIDAAYGDWIERRRDRVLCLTGNCGSDIRIAASRISEFCASTTETRAKAKHLQSVEEAETW